MSRTAREVAKKLKEIYYKDFGDDDSQKYQLSWADLRGISGVGKLEEDFVAEISEKMSETSFALLPLADFLLVGTELDFAFERKLPARLLERYLPGEEDTDDEDDFVEDEEFEDD